MDYSIKSSFLSIVLFSLQRLQLYMYFYVIIYKIFHCSSSISFSVFDSFYYFILFSNNWEAVYLFHVVFLIKFSFKFILPWTCSNLFFISEILFLLYLFLFFEYLILGFLNCYLSKKLLCFGLVLRGEFSFLDMFWFAFSVHYFLQ